MNYAEVFKIEDKSKEGSNVYALNSCEPYKEKLVPEFYKDYFRRELFFEIDILQVDEFLDFHYYESERPDLFLKILKLKILPDISHVIENAEISFENGEVLGEELSEGFYEKDGVIWSPIYRIEALCQYAAVVKAKFDLEERKTLIEDFIAKIQKTSLDSEIQKLKWVGKSTHLGMIIIDLVNKGYIDAPIKNNGDVNLSELSRLILSSFDFDEKPTVDTLRRYADDSSIKYLELMERYENEGYSLPFRMSFD